MHAYTRAISASWTHRHHRTTLDSPKLTTVTSCIPTQPAQSTHTQGSHADACFSNCVSLIYSRLNLISEAAHAHLRIIRVPRRTLHSLPALPMADSTVKKTLLLIRAPHRARMTWNTLTISYASPYLKPQCTSPFGALSRTFSW